MKKRFLGIFAALCLCLALLPAVALADEEGGSSASDAQHIHCVCGGKCSGVGDHTCNDTVVWTKWSNSTSLPTTTGNYYLTTDVTLSEKWTPANNTVLCLNGFNIMADKESNPSGKTFDAITVSQTVTFTLTDCKGTGKVTHAEGSTNHYGVTVNGTFYLYGGNIAENTQTGVSVDGTTSSKAYFYMYGGSVSNNTSTGVSGDSDSILYLYGGTISGNGGGGVNDGNSFYMYGGSISGNTNGGVSVSSSASFHMHGGSISGNSWYGVYMHHTVTNGTSKSSKMTISGDATVTNNGASGNILVEWDCTIEVGENFTGTAGVSYDSTIKVDYQVLTGSSVSTHYTQFTADDSSRCFKSDGKLSPHSYTNGAEGCSGCGAGHEQHCLCSGNYADHDCSNVTWLAWTSSDRLPDSGNYFLTTDVTINSAKTISENLAICLNGHTVTCSNSDQSYAFKLSGGTLSITDCTDAGTIKSSGSSKKTCIYTDPQYTSTFNMYGGTISGFSGYTDDAGNHGGAVLIYFNSTMNLYGGSITNNSADTDGGGVYCYSGTFNMYGGTVSNNRATNGGGVYFNSSDTSGSILGGTVTGNNATDGGGVYAVSRSTTSSGITQYGTFTIGGTAKITNNTAAGDGGGAYLTCTDPNTNAVTGGSITGNSAANGGGLYIDDPCSISNVSITGNTATVAGGGVYYNEPFENTDPLSLSGKVTVSGNYLGTDAGSRTANNLFLSKNSQVSCYSKLSVTDLNSTSTSSIGISSGGTPTDSSAIPISDSTGASYVDCFTSDNTGYFILATSGGGLELTTERADHIDLTGDSSIAVAVPTPKDDGTPDSATVALPTAKVINNSGTAMTGATATWSVVSVEGATGAALPAGVTLNNDGTVTVTSAALKDYTAGTDGTKVCTVTLQAKYDTLTSVSVTCTITRAASAAASVVITGVNKVNVPGITALGGTATSASYSYSTAVYDQFGVEMTGQTVNLQCSAGDTGVTFNNGTLTLDSTAQAGTVTITATVGNTSVSNTLDVTVSRDREYTYFKIYRATDNADVTGQTEILYCPASGMASVAYYAEVYDQYGEKIESPSGINWTATEGYSTAGVTPAQAQNYYNISVDRSGFLSEATFDVTVSGTQGTASAKMTVTVKARDNAGVTLSGSSATTYGTPITVTASVPEGTAGGTWSWTYDDELFTASGADTAAITLTPKKAAPAGSQVTATYSGTTVLGSKSTTVTVAKKTLTAADLEFTADSTFSKTYDGTVNCTTAAVQYANSAAVNTGDTLPNISGSCAYDSANVNGAAMVTFTTAAAENDNYILPAGLTVKRTAAITPASLTILSAVADDKEYDGTPNATVSEVNFSGLMTGDTLDKDTDYTATGSFADGNAGNGKTVSVTVTLLNTEMARNYSLSSFTAEPTANIRQKNVIVTCTTPTKVYDGETGIDVTATVSASGLIAGDSITVTGLKGTFDTPEVGTNKTVTIDTAYVQVSGTGWQNYRLIYPASISGAITPAPVTVTTAPTANTLTYNGGAQALVTAGAATNGTMQYSLNGTDWSATVPTGTDAGTYRVWYKAAGDGTNYSDSVESYVDVTVSAAASSVTTAPTANTLTYTGKAQALVTAGSAEHGTMQYSLNGTDWSATVPTGTNATGYTVWYKVVGDANYSDTQPASISASIGKAALTVTAKAKTVTYGDAPANNGVTYSGFVNGETASVLTGTLSYNYSYQQFGSVGDYTITPKGLTSGNYTVTFQDGTLTVEQKVVGIDWTNTALTYNGQPQAPTASATGLVNGDSVTVTVSGAQTDVGDDYTATATALSSGNYRLPDTLPTTGFSIAPAALTGVSVSQTGSLTYNGRAQTATVATAGTALGGQTIRFTYSTAQDGAYFGSVPAFTTGTNTVWYRASADGHVTATGSFTVTVGKATVTVTAASRSAYTYTSAPDLSSPVAGKDYTVSGLFGSDTLDGITVTLSCDADMKKAGEYAIVPTVTGEDVRYDFVCVNGTLTVTVQPSSGTPSYPITAPGAADNGSVTVPSKNAAAGTTVTITVTPDAGYTLESLTVLDKNGNEIELTDLGNGKYSFKMPAGKVEVKATFMEDNTMLNFFVDVPTGAYYYDAVLWAVKNGITGGMDATHFAPDATCTRAQLVTFLWRAAGCPVVNYAMSFTDVDENAWYGEAVRWAASLGIVGGYGNGLFGTNDTVTREQVATILYRYAAAMGMDVSVGEDTNILNYNDTFEVSGYAVSAFQWATGAGVVNGSDGNLMPGAGCTRAQIVTMLYRLLGK